MKMFSLILISFFLLNSGCSSLDRTAYSSDSSGLIEFRNFIQPELLRTHMEIIAHDSLEGRGTATPGIRKAADYIAHYYRELGFSPVGDEGSFFQSFDLTTTKIDSLVYTIYKSDAPEQEAVRYSVEKSGSAADFTSILTGYQSSEGPIVFAGYGIDDKQAGIEQLDPDLIENAWVLIFEDIPDILQENWSLSNNQLDVNQRIRNILDHYGANGVLLITDFSADLYREFIGSNIHFNQDLGRMRLAYLQDPMSRQLPGENVKYIEPTAAAALLGVNYESELLNLKAAVSVEPDQFSSTKTPFTLNYRP